MEKELEEINLVQTGDPFIDVGAIVINYLQEVFPRKTTLDLIEYATHIYVNQWEAKLHTYFLNSSITQPAFDSNKKISETIKYYKSLLDGTHLDSKYGSCRILGIETKLFGAGRSNHMMSASGAFINFHSAFDGGIYLSKDALIRAFFIPLGVCFVGDKIALLQSNNYDLTAFLIKNNVKENLRNIASGLGKGTLKSNFGIVANALFDYADICISNLKLIVNASSESVLEHVQLNMYHFTNFGASPDIALYTFSNRLFYFYAYCKNNYSKEWNWFINQHYKYSKFKNAQFDVMNQEWYNNTERLKKDNYKVWYNPILEKLLKDKPILGTLCRWSRQNKFSFNIVEIYCINLLKMDKYTILKIKELSDFILRDKSDDQIKKAIVGLNILKSSTGFRSYLIKLIKENYEAKSTNALLTIEDYVFYLSPDGTYWKDTRDLLLMAIYQKLHELNLIIEGIPEAEENEEN
ncbi:MAG TPA: type I-B CRISPR-associated protein Cas8b1/Cst1 [Cytophagaceae bacterium]